MNGIRFTIKNVVKSQQFDIGLITYLLILTDIIKKMLSTAEGREELSQFLLGKKLLTFFYEPSTRTRLSFQYAGAHLGMNVLGTENARDFSSAVKGETLEDTFDVICGYFPDVIVLRHTEKGAAERAALITDKYGIPLINAGDGIGQHPTQSLLDIYTIFEKFGHMRDLNVLMVGDLKHGRTVRSLAYLLAKFPRIKLRFLAPSQLQMENDLLEHLDKHGINYRCYTEKNKIDRLWRSADVIYLTRVQKERMTAELYEKVKDIFIVNRNKVRQMKKSAMLMHPLPRINEITQAVDKDPRAWYKRQAHNGLPLRMALLMILVDTVKTGVFMREKIDFYQKQEVLDRLRAFQEKYRK
jgi:aspartate carbamoyltransferase catalytic subunit